VNQQCYLGVLTRLREPLCRKGPWLWLWPDRWILNHDDGTTAHDELGLREFLAKGSITKVDHDPHSLDLVPRGLLTLPTSNATARHSGGGLSSLKNGVFWDATSCDFCNNRRFGGTYRLHHQGDKNRRARNNVTVNSNRSMLRKKTQ
jgi:hypothetical protein